MPDLLKSTYARTGESTRHNAMGMRPMQAKAYAQRDAQYLLLKSPPASGKSRALMFVALDKLANQGMRKVIVAVPERSIAGSFNDTELSRYGFFTDWSVDVDLCGMGNDESKVSQFVDFMQSDAKVLLCTHATLRFAFAKLSPTDFNDCLLAVDEFHHTSADRDNRLGDLIDKIMKGSTGHILAMTGSYFRGDQKPILMPEDEELFTKVTYTYYEQLNGYEYLTSLGIGYHFYTGQYLDGIAEVLDTSKKTLIHIPNVNSLESTKDKYEEVDRILDIIGQIEAVDKHTHIATVRTPEGRELRVANLVDDDYKRRPVTMEYLRGDLPRDDIDIIIALGMAKEGFDWTWCEHVLTVGYRSSLTEVVQIIGRATRDAPGKEHAQFTNLIARPDAQDKDVAYAVNNMLKAITASLLMEQVFAPNFKFKARTSGEPLVTGTTISIGDGIKPVSDRVLDILNGDTADIITDHLRNEDVASGLMTGQIDPEVASNVELPKLIEEKYPDLSPEEVEDIRTGVMTQIVMGIQSLIDQQAHGRDAGEVDDPAHDSEDSPKPRISGLDGDEATKRLMKVAGKLINVADLNIYLIDQINPFMDAYEILSKSLTAASLKTIQDELQSKRISVSEEEAVLLWPKIQAFRAEHGREPSVSATDAQERRYAEVLTYIRNEKRKRQANEAHQGTV